jgi:hypothetical protein
MPFHWGFCHVKLLLTLLLFFFFFLFLVVFACFVVAQKYLDQSSCAKCQVKYVDGNSGQPIMLRQVLLKWIPNKKYEYPEQLFDAILGVDTRSGEVVRADATP